MSKKIAYVGVKGLPSKAGADRVVEAIVRRLDHQQFQPIVYCSGREVSPDTSIPGVTLKRMPTLPGKHLHATSLFVISALHALFRGNYDLIHMHNVEACFVLPLLRLRYRAISTSHGSAYARDKWGKFAKKLIRLTEYPYILFSNCLTSVARPLAEYYETNYHKPIEYIPNGIDDDIRVDREAASALLAENGVEAGNYIMFAAGRIIPTKGCHFLLEAFRNIDSDIKLLVVGDATHVPAYQEELQRLADSRVRFVPFIASKATLFGLISLARFFVFPSTVEAMSMMLLEVASAGTPILCSDIPENSSVLPEQALFFESGNVQELQSRLEWALQHPQQMAQMAQQAQAWVEANYRWRDIIEEYERLYLTF